jgi:predicted Rdx family selenoprotein
LAAEIAGGRNAEVSIAITPSGEGGTFQVLLDGQEVFNRKSLASGDGPIPDPKLLKELGGQLRGKVLAAVEQAPAAAGR